jgi:hypothetical protein
MKDQRQAEEEKETIGSGARGEEDGEVKFSTFPALGGCIRSRNS